MTTSTLLLALVLSSSPDAAPSPPLEQAPRENLLRGPARVVLRYLDAVRLAGPRGADATARTIRLDEAGYARAKRLLARRSLEDIEQRAARGGRHPLAFWREAERARVLEGFQLLAVRRGPRSTVVVTVEERHWHADAPERPLDRTVSEYLAARVDGDWKVVDRRVGRSFDDESIARGYDGYWDEPLSRAP